MNATPRFRTHSRLSSARRPTTTRTPAATRTRSSATRSLRSRASSSFPAACRFPCISNMPAKTLRTARISCWVTHRYPLVSISRGSGIDSTSLSRRRTGRTAGTPITFIRTASSMTATSSATGSATSAKRRTRAAVRATWCASGGTRSSAGHSKPAFAPCRMRRTLPFHTPGKASSPWVIRDPWVRS